MQRCSAPCGPGLSLKFARLGSRLPEPSHLMRWISTHNYPRMTSNRNTVEPYFGGDTVDISRNLPRPEGNDTYATSRSLDDNTDPDRSCLTRLLSGFFIAAATDYCARDQQGEGHSTSRCMLACLPTARRDTPLSGYPQHR